MILVYFVFYISPFGTIEKPFTPGRKEIYGVEIIFGIE